jgi:hypothetical protein
VEDMCYDEYCYRMSAFIHKIGLKNDDSTKRIYKGHSPGASG